MNIKPLNGRVLVKINERPKESPGGILLPDQAQRVGQREGVVKAVGDGAILPSGNIAPVEVEVGDTVIYAEFGGSVMTLEGEEYNLVPHDKIYAIVERG